MRKIFLVKMKGKVAVVGAGPSGLASVKSCLEDGLEVKCYEMTNHIGGVWLYDENQVEEGLASMFKSVHMNTSRDMTAFSDFPPPSHFANYMPHSQNYRYLQMYADHFELRPHVRLRHRVVSVEQSSDFDVSGRWLVRVKDLENDIESEEIFDFVMICIGVNFLPNVPSFPGMDEFEGRVVHSKHYKTPDAFRDQTVVVIGLSPSGVDIAVDVCRVGCKTYLSTRRRGWIRRRAGRHGKPADAQLNTQFEECLRTILPYSVYSRRWENKSQQILDHDMYSLKPKHHYFSQFPIVSDTLPLYLFYGDIRMKPDISKFTSKGVIFQGESCETPVDTVICTTGYQTAFPFLQPGIADVANPDDIYKFIFPLRPKHQTLAIIGYAVPEGPTIPVFEMQARVAVQVFAGQVQLPSKKTMLAEMKRNRTVFQKEFYQEYRKITHVRWVAYFNELGTIIGAKPNLFWMLLRDPHLFWHCFFGPRLPFLYRLQGPHAWSQARDVILHYETRISDPLCSSKSLSTECCGFWRCVRRMFLVVPVFAVGFVYIVCKSKRSFYKIPALSLSYFIK